MAGIVSRRRVLSRRKGSAIASGCNPPSSDFGATSPPASILAKPILQCAFATPHRVQVLTTPRPARNPTSPAPNPFWSMKTAAVAPSLESTNQVCFVAAPHPRSCVRARAPRFATLTTLMPRHVGKSLTRNWRLPAIAPVIGFSIQNIVFSIPQRRTWWFNANSSAKVFNI